MNPFALSGLLTGLSSIAMGLFVLSRDRTSRLNQLWCYFTFSVALWGFGGMGIGLVQEPSQALWVWRLSFALGVLWIPILFFHFVCHFCDLPFKKTVFLNYLIGSLYCPIILFSGTFFGNVRYVFSSFYYNTPGSFLFTLFFIWWIGLVLYAHYWVFKKFQSASGIKRNQLKYFFVAFSLAYGTGSLDYFPIFGFDFYPWGNFGIVLYPIVMTYAIVKYRVMDISMVVNKGLAYILLLSSIFLPVYLLIAASQETPIYSLPPLLAAIFTFSCGLWIVLKNPKSAVNLTYSLVCLGVSVWLFSMHRFYSVSNRQEALLWAKIAYTGVVLIPAFFFHFCERFLQRPKGGPMIVGNYILSGIFLLSIPTSYLVPNVYSYFFGFYPKAGPLHALFLIYFAFAGGLSLRKLYRGYQSAATPLEAARISYVFWAFVVAYFASLDFVQTYGYEFYPTGYLFVILWAMIVSYAIAKYSVMDISLVFSKEKIYSLLRSLALAGFYFAVLGLIRIFTGSYEYLLSGFLVALSLGLSGSLMGLQTRMENQVEQVLFGKRFEEREKLTAFRQKIVTILDPEELNRKVVEILATVTKVRHVTLFLQNSEGDYHLTASSPGTVQVSTIIQADLQRAFFSWLEQQEQVVELEELEHDPQYKSILPMARGYFNRVGANVCLPLVHQRKLIGIINLGEKNEGGSYSGSEIDFLANLRAEASVALSNAMVYHGAQQISQELQYMVEQQTTEISASKQELERSYQKLKELDQLKSQFFANVSHEVRTPLTLILAPLQSLLALPTLPEEVHRQLTISYQNGLRLLRLINNLLDFAKIDAGKMSLAYERIELVQFLRNIVTSVSPLAEKKQIDLLFIAPEEPITFYFDPDKIERAVLNLVFNALKFTPMGGEVAVSCRLDGQSVQFSILDTGIGIAKENLSRLFSRFSQIDASASRQFEGTGLGLALAKDFIELHQGKIGAESDPGKGTAMTFTLPYLSYLPEGIAEGDRHKSMPEVDWTRALQRSAEYSSRGIIKENLPAPPSLKDKKEIAGEVILLVEDNADMLQFLEAQLQNHYQVITAIDGIQGRELALEHRPALIVSDVMMPGKDGYQLCRELKEDPRTSHIPVILLTAKVELQMKIEGLACGADDYLTKPFSNEELQARIKSLLNLKGMKVQLIHSEKMAALGLLAAGMTHEVNNPLNFAKVNLSNLRRAVDALLNELKEKGISLESEIFKEALEEIPDDLRIVATGLERIERIVHDLKSYIRKDSDSFGLMDLHEGLGSTLNMMKGEFHGVQVIEEFGDIGDVEIIPGKLNQVFMNLLQNAIHAVPPDQKGEIRIKTWREEGLVFVSIKDNGSGIPPQNLTRIFDPFFTTKEVGRGTGLGLWVCDQIVKLHGGRIEVSSNPGIGTEMTVVLPKYQKMMVQSVKE
jgi:signal transduction histidine kinase